MTSGDETKWRHDLKNQIGIVLGFSELLLNEIEETSPFRADVQEIYNAAQRSMELVAKLSTAAAERRQPER